MCVWADLLDIYNPGTFDGEVVELSIPERIAPLFSPELRTTTILVWGIWASASMAYSMYPSCLINSRYYSFLPKFLISVPSFFSPQADYVIISFAGIPGSVAAMYAVDTSLGRKGTMVISTVSTLISLLAFVLFSTNTAGVDNHSATAFILLVANMAASFASNIMWGVLYSFTPEAFPTPVRATAYGIASSFSKMAGIFAPLATGIFLRWGGIELPLWVSVGLFGVEAGLMWMLPFDTRDISAL